MKINEFYSLIEKYKRGECSPLEKKQLEKYLDSFQIHSGEWNENEMGDKKITEEKIYSEILKNIGKGKKPYIYRIFFSPELLKRAAVIFFILITVTGILYVSGLFQQKTEPVIWYEKTTSSGEKCSITLKDGSIITLNAGSKLRFPDQFTGKSRELYLEGEAYFEVYHNVNQPFILHTGNLSTTVLGTIFNVSAYPENKNIAVSLLEGKVKISSVETKRNNKTVFLKPKEQLLYDKINNISSFGIYDSLKIVGWRNNTFKFMNEPLQDVIIQLERAFGIKINITSQTALAQRVTIKLEKSSAETIIEVIKNLTGLDYEIVKRNNVKEVIYYKNTK